MKPFEQSALRRLSHDLRGSVASLRVGLQAVNDSPEMLADLSSALMEEVEKLDRRLLQIHWMSRSAYPQKRAFDLGTFISEQSGQPLTQHSTIGDTDLLLAAWQEALSNAKLHGGGLGTLKLTSREDGWSLLIPSSKPWPEGLANWLESESTELWQGRLCLGLALQKWVLRAHSGRVYLGPEGLVWEVG